MAFFTDPVEVYEHCIFLNEANNYLNEFNSIESDLKKLGFDTSFDVACEKVKRKFGARIKSIKFNKFINEYGHFIILIILTPGDRELYYDEEALALDVENALGDQLNKDAKLSKKFKFDGSQDTPGIYVFRK